MEIVKTCIHHGELTREQVNVSVSRGKTSIRCKLCQRASHSVYYERNKDKVRAKCKEYREKDPVKLRLMKRRSALKHYDKHREKRNRTKRINWYKYHDRKLFQLRERKRKGIEDLSDSYVLRQLKRCLDMQYNEIPKEFIEIKRAMLSIHRRRKEENNRCK